MLDRKAPAQRSARHSASVVPYTACQRGLSFGDGSQTNDCSGK